MTAAYVTGGFWGEDTVTKTVPPPTPSEAHEGFATSTFEPAGTATRAPASASGPAPEATREAGSLTSLASAATTSSACVGFGVGFCFAL